MIFDEQLKRLRALKVIELKVFRNMNKRQIMAELNISKDTLDRTLSWAKRAGLFVELEDRMLSELAPRAAERVQRELEKADGDVWVAVKVLEGTGLLKKATDKPALQQGTSDDLADYIARKRQLAADREQSIDGAIVGDVLALPAAKSPGEVPPDADGGEPSSPSGDPQTAPTTTGEDNGEVGARVHTDALLDIVRDPS